MIPPTPSAAHRHTGVESVNTKLALHVTSALGEGSTVPCLLRLAQWGVIDLKSGNSKGTGLGAQVGGAVGVNGGASAARDNLAVSQG